jgi:cytochrome P450
VRQAREAGWYARTSYGLAVLRYDQVSRLIRHPDLRQGSRLWPAHHGITSGPFAYWWASWVLNMEGEEHHRLRRLLNPAFSRRLVEPLRPRFGALAAELVDGFAEPGRCEFMAEFAEPYAARVIAILLGIPEEEWPTIAAESAAVGLAMGVRIRDHLPRIEAALARLYDYADALIADRQRSPRDDFVTCLVQAQAVDPGRRGEAGRAWMGGEAGLTAAELRDSLVLLIFGGFDTTRNQLGLAMQAFLDHPGQWRLLAERPRAGAGRGRGGHADPPHHDLGHPRGDGGLHLRRARHQGRHHDPPVLRIGRDRPGRTRDDAGPGAQWRGSTSRRASGVRTSVSAAASITASATTWRGRTCARP